jgi:hypothetical protein
MRTTRSSVGWRSGNPIQRCSIMSTVYGNLRHCFGSDHDNCDRYEMDRNVGESQALLSVLIIHTSTMSSISVDLSLRTNVAVTDQGIAWC